MKSNKSKTYLLPYIHDYIGVRHINLLINTYLFFEGEYKFCLLYEFSGKKEFLKYEDDLLSNEYFSESIDIDNDKVLYVFDIPEELFKVIELFIEGKYSYLPEKDKIKKFLIRYFRVPKKNKIFSVLDRSEELKEYLEGELNVNIPDGLDLSDPPDLDAEEFKVKKNNEEEQERKLLPK